MPQQPVSFIDYIGSAVCMSNQVLECLLIVTLLNELVDSLNLPPLELCKSCHWEHCRRLLQSQCSHSGKDEAETVVYMDQSRKEVFEIRCPLNYLRMQNKPYQCNHTLAECMHRPKHNCNYPHSKVEEDIWNAWKTTASANVRSRTAVSWSCSLPFASAVMCLFAVDHEYDCINICICRNNSTEKLKKLVGM